MRIQLNAIEVNFPWVNHNMIELPSLTPSFLLLAILIEIGICIQIVQLPINQNISNPHRTKLHICFKEFELYRLIISI